MPESLTNTTEISRSDIAHALNRRPRKMRARRVAKDRFGRVYVYWEDLNAEAPVGLIDRLFHAPVVIPDQYLKFDADRPWRIDYNLTGWLRDTLEEERQWDERLKETMRRLYKEKGAEAMMPGGSGPTEAALEIVGRRPVPSLLIRALAHGDPWCLGFSAERTPLVEEILGKETKTEREARRKPRREVEPALQLPPALRDLVGKAAVPQRFEDEEDDDETAQRLAAINRAAEADAREEEEDDDFDDDAGSDVLTGEDESEDSIDALFEGGESDELDGVDDEEPEVRKPRSGKGSKNPKMPREV